MIRHNCCAQTERCTSRNSMLTWKGNSEASLCWIPYIFLWLQSSYVHCTTSRIVDFKLTACLTAMPVTIASEWKKMNQSRCWSWHMLRLPCTTRLGPCCRPASHTAWQAYTAIQVTCHIYQEHQTHLVMLLECKDKINLAAWSAVMIPSILYMFVYRFLYCVSLKCWNPQLFLNYGGSFQM
jgi:hypothetical protein